MRHLEVDCEDDGSKGVQKAAKFLNVTGSGVQTSAKPVWRCLSGNIYDQFASLGNVFEETVR